MLTETTNNQIILNGWVDAIRELGQVKFIIVRSRLDKYQVVIKKNAPESVRKIVDGLNREDVLEIIGEKHKDERAPLGFEIIPSEIKILAKSKDKLPIEFRDEIQTEESKRFDWRFLDLRNPKRMAIFKIKQVFISASREFLESEDFMEIHSPKIVGTGAEGGSEVFPVVYYSREAFLAQSPQFYKQFGLSCGFEKVFEIGAVYRAETSHTTRHLTEFISLDLEMSFIKSDDDIRKLEEKMLKFCLEKVKEKCKKELEIIGVEVKVPKIPFARITFADALKKLGVIDPTKNDLSGSEEKQLGKIIENETGSEFVFVTNYFFSKRPFYTMKDEKNPRLTKSFDLLWKGLEVTTGGQREHRHDILLNQCKEKGVPTQQIATYLDAFKYGMPAEGGLGIGIERIVMQMLNLPNIQEASFFPRTPDRLEP